MQYLKKSFTNLKGPSKINAINELIKNLNELRDNINSNSNGDILFSYIDFEEDMEDQIDELKKECKLTKYYSKEEIEKMKKDIVKIKEKIKIYSEIINAKVSKSKEYDHNEGWMTTYREILIKINLKDNIKLEFKFQYEFNGYDSSDNLFRSIKIYNNNVKLILNKDYYKEDGKYYNGKKIIMNVDTLSNFQKNLEEHCKDNNIDFEKLSDKELAKLMKDNLENSKKLKKEIDDHQKNKNTKWTLLMNIILEKFKDGEEFCDFFDMIDY